MATKRVRIVTAIASSEDWAYAPGQVVDLPAAQADAFVESGIAAAVEAEGTGPETATAGPRSDASLPAARKRVRG